jgi:protein SCO1
MKTFLILALLLALPAGASTPVEDGARRYFGDTVLIDQDGRELRLFTDLMAGKVVLIHAGFVDCKTDCPLTASILQKVQEHLGARLGADVRILSITLDPESDTPARLKEHASKLQVRPGWHFLTGKPEDVEAVLGKLGLTAPDRDKHKPLFLVGNVPTGLWKKVFPLADTEELLAVVDSVLDDPGEEGGRP